MSKYSQRIEALENNEKKKRRIFTAIIILLVVIFIGGMIIGAQNILNTEGVFDPYAETATEPIKSNQTASETVEKLAASLNAKCDYDKVKLSVYTDVEIDDDSFFDASGDSNIVAELKYIKKRVLEKIKEYYTVYEGSFGEDFSDKLIPSTFGVNDIESAACERGRLNDEGELCDLDTLFYTVEFPETEFENIKTTPLFESLGMDISEEIRDTFINDIGEIADVKKAAIICKDFRITAEINETTGEIKNAWYIRGYSVVLSLAFKGDLEELGSQEIGFDFYAKESHWYTRAGLTLSSHELRIEKGDVSALEAKKETDDEVTVTWTSSNPDIAPVDDRGYVKGKTASTQPVTITATFDYRGNTYTDSCTVFVRKPVEEIKTTPKELELKQGGTAQLSAKISPKKATIHDVLWFTEDEEIATVDANGTVTATGAGTTKVYAISADGYYRSSCTVTVIGGESNGN